MGGITMGPQTPVEPLLILSAKYAAASLRSLYLAAISLKAGPTIFLATEWQFRQALLSANSRLAFAAMLLLSNSAPKSMLSWFILLFMLSASFNSNCDGLAHVFTVRLVCTIGKLCCYFVSARLKLDICFLLTFAKMHVLGRKRNRFT